MILYISADCVATTQGKELSEDVSQEERSDLYDNYLIGVYEDRVAVFSGGDLMLKTDTQVSSLPKADRKRLELGIQVDSEEELKALMQDYCS